MKKILFSIFMILLLAACRGPAVTHKSDLSTTDLPSMDTATPTDISSLATATPIEIPWLEITDPSPTVWELADDLEGLLESEWFSLDDFFWYSFELIIARSYENIAGVETYFDTGKIGLDDISEEYRRETYELIRVILGMLRTYDRDSMLPEDQLSYDLYEWYLEEMLQGEEFLLFGYPVSHFIYNMPFLTLRFFTIIHPLHDATDVENYITRLSFVDDKFGQLIENLEKSEEAGIVHPRFTLEWAIGDISEIANGIAITTPYYTTLEERIYEVPGLDDKDIKAYLNIAEKVIEESVIPGYQTLLEYMEHMLTVATDDDGLWQFEGGDEYYAYLLHYHTTTDMTADEIHNLGLQELERIHAEMREAFDDLGYPKDESLQELYERVAEDGGYVPANEMVETFEAILAEAKMNIYSAFDRFPWTELIVVGVPTHIGGYYTPGSYDGSRPGIFYAEVTGNESPLYEMYTLAYDEGIPGHHFQNSLSNETYMPGIRNIVGITAYSEGWALYAERLAWELGWYKDNPYGNLGRLQDEALRAARLVVDTGIHAKRWTYDEAVDFMIENTGLDYDTVYYEVGRYIVEPGQATSYMVGMLKILEIRQMAMERLGEDFDLIEFHHVVLSNGDLPLSLLERLIEDYVEAKLEGVEIY